MRTFDDEAGRPPAISKPLVLSIVIITTALGPLALNMPLPSMPGMAEEFGTSYGVVQLTLTLYLAALAIAQLSYGPLSDMFGRRPVMIAGLSVFVLGCIACALAPTVESLIAARVVQGAGGCVGMVLGRAILRDLFDRRRAASLLGYVTMAMVTAPMLGPAVGGVLDATAGWRAGFWLLAGVGTLFALLTAARLPETHASAAPANGFSGLAGAARDLVLAPAFLAYTSVMAFVSAMFFSFLAGAPLIVVGLMGRSPAEYGFWFVTNAAGYMLGNFITGRRVEKVGILKLMAIGTAGNLAAIAVLIAAIGFGPFVPATLFLPMAVTAFFNGLLMPTSIAGAVSVRPDLAGAASGLAGFMQMSLAAVVTMVVAAWNDGSAVPTLTVVTASGVIAAFGYLSVRRIEGR